MTISGCGAILFQIAFLASWSASIALAQQGRDARIVLTAGGPTAAVRSITFSNDSRRLYLAGADKSVEIWTIVDGIGGPNLSLAEHGRWPIARHDRGQIWTLAANPKQNQIAFAGYGAQQISGDISICSANQGVQLAILPPVMPNESPQLRFQTGHLQTVNSLSYSPNGEWLVSISLDGDTRLWSVGTWTSRQLQSAGQNPTSSNTFVQFISNTQLIATTTPTTNSPVPQITLFTIGNDRRITSEPLTSPHQVLITAVGSEPGTERWYSGDAKGRIVFWEGRHNFQTRVSQAEIPVRSIAASSNGLVMTLHSPTISSQNTKEKAYVELLQVAAGNAKLIDRREWNLPGVTLAAAISRDGRFAAISRPGESAVEVFSLFGQNNQFRPKPFSDQRPTVLSGSGSTIHRIQFAKTPEALLAISAKSDGSWTHGFNLATSEVIRPNGLGAIQPAHSANAWHVKVGPSLEAQPQSLSVEVAGVNYAAISLDHRQHGHYAAHAWIFEAGKQSPSAIAVGTERQNGIFIFDLRQEGQAPMIRYYRDHTNTITSLSQSVDCRYLASSSQDQTVRVWNLQDLFTRSVVFPKRAAWGADFEIRIGQLVVTSTQEFGVLRSRGLQDGDQIVKIAFADPKQNGKRAEVNAPHEILKVLQDILLTESVEMHVFRPAVNVPPFIVTPAWEPMVTLFIDRRNEWAAWTPAGYYNSSVDGDGLFGFQINPPSRGGQPLFSRAEQLRQDYERPELMQKLFALGSFKDAANSVAIVPKNAGTVVAVLPRLQIVDPSGDEVYQSGQQIAITADVDYSGLPARNFVVDAWLDGAKLEPPAVALVGTSSRYKWTVKPTAGDHRLQVRVESLGPTPTSGIFVDSTVPLVVSGEPPKRKVHVLAIGANNYQGALRLNYCVKDADSIIQIIRNHAGNHYELGHVKLLVDSSPDQAAKFQKQSFVNELNQYAELLNSSSLRPEDLVVVFLAGHGEAIGKEFYFVPPVPEIKNLAQQANIQKHSIPWSSFRAFVERIPNCGKAFFVDTCYSGNIARLESDKARIRPLKSMNVVVVAATAEDQVAREDDANQHGRFTTVLIDGLNGRADGSEMNPELAGRPANSPDGQISLLEIVGYVSRHVYERWRDQQPKCTPLDLLRAFDYALIKLPPADSIEK